MRILYLLFLLVLVLIGHAKNPSTYRVAVAPTQFHRNQTTDLDLTANVAFMIHQIQKAANQGAQIVVFGEQQVNFPDSLDTSCSWRLVVQSFAEYIPTITNATQGKIIPCEDPLWENRIIARQFSCAARDNSIYVAYNAYTSYPCTESEIGSQCPPGGLLVFNTLVILDRHGALVAKYYKRNIQTEAPGVVEPTPAILGTYPDTPVFTADFGVTFGLLICYDVARGYPLSDHMNAGIRNFLWSTAFDGIPGFLTHVGIAQGLARVTGSNVICASGAGKGISGGSAIVSGPRTLGINFRPTICTGEYADEVPEECFDLVVSDVPIVPLQENSEQKEILTENSEIAEILKRTKNSEDSEPYACDPVNYLPDGIPSWVQPILGLEATCASSVATPGTTSFLSATFGEVSCFVNFSVSAESPNVPTKFTLHATEAVFWMPDSPCPLRAAACSFSAEFPECTNFPNCPAKSYESPLLFSEISLSGHIGSEYSVIPQAMEHGGSMSTDKFDFLKINRTSINSCIPEIVFSVRSKNVTVIFTSLLGIYSKPNWPADCNSCFDPFKGPEYSGMSHFAPDTVRGMVRYFLCSECSDKDGWKNVPVWPPAWAHS